ncbi:hypothetical protein R5H30_12340 [Sulfitobacter sp. D35]|uniref:hypothetical protein n=1 Tax=Sulfitobacter sp. D35 TaxID=3083252 RepID=UPI00296E66BE|nr:hypothetical protein [Sulfitobacter sp. D35]MDW4498776.1 hypothetical protein [Sulfitobacter sp. D35]
MPDLDSGHIFLTTLAPVKGGTVEGGTGISHRQRLSRALSELPTAQQSPATQKTGMNSPFARNTRTHLARMFLLDDVIFNGRVPENTLIAGLRGRDPINPQELDRLNSAYLVFCADIDAVEEDGDPLPANLSAEQQKRVRRAYAKKLWETMGEELADIYGNCVGFDGVSTADGFADYLEKCHVETTMPFHDYYLDLPKFNDLPVKPLIAAVALPLVVALLALVLRLFGATEMPLIGGNPMWVFVIGLILTLAAAYGAIQYAYANGNKPLAPAKYDDLPSVLKALYVQQKFSQLAIDMQGEPPAAIHKAFGEFLEQHRPADRGAPTQPPGVISSTAPIQ